MKSKIAQREEQPQKTPLEIHSMKELHPLTLNDDFGTLYLVCVQLQLEKQGKVKF